MASEEEEDTCCQERRCSGSCCGRWQRVEDPTIQSALLEDDVAAATQQQDGGDGGDDGLPPAAIPNDAWVDVPEALAKPLSAESTAASPQPKVRLETLSERALTVGAVVLLFGFTVPYASFKLRRDLYDDDFVRSPDACSYINSNHTSYDDDDDDDDDDNGGHLGWDDDRSTSWDDAEIDKTCLWEASTRLVISACLVAACVAWCVTCWRHWGCGGGCGRGSGGQQRRTELWILQQGAVVLLFFVGQLLLEDPWAAWRVRYHHDVSELRIELFISMDG